MKSPYMDTLDEYYNTIDHSTEPELRRSYVKRDSITSNTEGPEQTKPTKIYSKNDQTIGKISLVLIIAFVAYIIWTIIDAYAYGATPEGVNPDAYIAKLEEIKQYCLDHVDRILAGGNPVKDLINAGMIRSDIFQNITCQNVDKEILWADLGKGELLADALGID